MATWTDLTFAYGSLLTSTKMTQLDANLDALAEGASGAPKIQTAAIQDSAITGAKLANGAVTSDKIYTNAVASDEINTNGTWNSHTVTNGNYYTFTTGVYMVAKRAAYSAATDFQVRLDSSLAWVTINNDYMFIVVGNAGFRVYANGSNITFDEVQL